MAEDLPEKLSLNETLFKQLMLASQTGDSQAYRKLLNGLSLFLKNYLRKRIFEKNDIEEITQEILMAIHKSLHTYDSQKSFMGWFMAITEYKIIDYIRSLKKQTVDSDITSINNLFNEIESNTDLKIDIEKALKKLTTRERAVLTLLKLEGHSIDETAQQLKLSVSNVKVIAHRAYINLKIYLGTP